ncbi:MAG: hypothetical protein H6683_06440 [Deltaproteobacteria bacterium]|nr:hypothetical protein [Deltaproteobacteria bacterium]
MTDEPASYLVLWRRIREQVEALIEGNEDRDTLDALSRLLERVQKGEAATREQAPDAPVVVNVHIPTVCGKDDPVLPTDDDQP